MSENEANKPRQGLPKEQMVLYLRDLASRIEKDEAMKLVVCVEARGVGGTASYGHKAIGEVFLQIEDQLFANRLSFVLPQILPQSLNAVAPHILQSQMGSSR